MTLLETTVYHLQVTVNYTVYVSTLIATMSVYIYICILMYDCYFSDFSNNINTR